DPKEGSSLGCRVYRLPRAARTAGSAAFPLRGRCVCSAIEAHSPRQDTIDMHPDPPPERSAAALRITFITHYTELYGANLSLSNLIEGLGRYGVRSHVICPEPGDLPAAL